MNNLNTHVAERLRSNVVAWLVTVRADGRPHVVTVWYLWDEESNTFLVFSKPEQQKVKNIRNNPQVALAIDDSDQGKDPIVIEGRAELIDDPNISTTLPAYAEKYAGRMKPIGLYPPEKMAAIYSQGIRITPTRVW